MCMMRSLSLSLSLFISVPTCVCVSACLSLCMFVSVRVCVWLSVCVRECVCIEFGNVTVLQNWIYYYFDLSFKFPFFLISLLTGLEGRRLDRARWKKLLFPGKVVVCLKMWLSIFEKGKEDPLGENRWNEYLPAQSNLISLT